MDPALNTDQRAACWASWLEHYTLGQPKSRVAYARTRADALAHGEALPALTGLDEDKFDAVYTASFLSMDGGDSAAVDAAVPAADPSANSERRMDRSNSDDASPRQSPCARVCEPRYTACIASCDEVQTSCLKTCRSEEKTCLSACL